MPAGMPAHSTPAPSTPCPISCEFLLLEQRPPRCHQLSNLPPMDVRPEQIAERTALLDLLSGFTHSDWAVMTAAEGWTVKAVALHLLDDDLGWLSRGRDTDQSGTLDMSNYASFVEALAAKN